MSTMPLEQALQFIHRIENGMISGRISEWLGLKEACGVVYAHVTQSAQGVVVPDELTQQVFRTDDPERFGYVRGFNACRDLVLAAALPQTECAVMPDGWMFVPVAGSDAIFDAMGQCLTSESKWAAAMKAAAPSQPKD